MPHVYFSLLVLFLASLQIPSNASASTTQERLAVNCHRGMLTASLSVREKDESFERVFDAPGSLLIANRGVQLAPETEIETGGYLWGKFSHLAELNQDEFVIHAAYPAETNGYSESGTTYYRIERKAGGKITFAIERYYGGSYEIDRTIAVFQPRECEIELN